MIGSDNGLAPDRRQAIIWINDEILLIGPWESNFTEIFIKYNNFRCVWKCRLEYGAHLVSASMC